MQHTKALTELLPTAQAAALIAEISGRPCGPENVRRLARNGELDVAVTLGNGHRLFARRTVERFALRRKGNEAA